MHMVIRTTSKGIEKWLGPDGALDEAETDAKVSGNASEKLLRASLMEKELAAVVEETMERIQ